MSELRIEVRCTLDKVGYKRTVIAIGNDGKDVPLDRASRILTGTATEDAAGIFNNILTEFRAYGIARQFNFSDPGQCTAEDYLDVLKLRAEAVREWADSLRRFDTVAVWDLDGKPKLQTRAIATEKDNGNVYQNT